MESASKAVPEYDPEVPGPGARGEPAGQEYPENNDPKFSQIIKHGSALEFYDRDSALQYMNGATLPRAVITPQQSD